LGIESVLEPPVQTASAEVPALDKLMQLLFGKHITFSISAVARLCVADHMSAAPVHVNEIAAKTGTISASLYRVMRMLAAVGVFEEYEGQRFALTPVGELLRSSAPNSMRDMATMWGEHWSARAFAYLPQLLQKGGDGVTAAYGRNVFELFKDHPAEAETFQRAMSNFSQIAAAALVDAYDFSDIKRLADVGGGHGTLVGGILKRYPSLQGVVFDLPEVVAGAMSHGDLDHCAGRVTIEGGNFFERVPSGCDAYILKHIIHDWSDAHCQTILRLIREQLPRNGRVLLCEMVVPNAPGPGPAKMLDIEMLTLTVGGKERTEAEFRDLFASAGLELTKIVPTPAAFCVIEARPAR
jgi:hypothetical protein